MRRARVLAVVWIVGLPAWAEDAPQIDFARDVQPLFKAHCVDCHGPRRQRNGFRLDRRSDAMKGGTIAMIGPGNSAGSRLYRKLVGSEFGPQMPPDGPLATEEIEVIKLWIDQGAVWPDEFAGEKPQTVPDPRATRMMAAVRDGDRQAFENMIRDDRDVAKLAGPGGSTPLMYAALYADAEAVRLLLEAGADANERNDAGATALMWAVDDAEKTELLIKAGADVNARSDDSRTPLLIATGRVGAAPIVRMLLDHGADPSARAPTYRGGISPVRQAIDIGDDEVVRMLIESGADVKRRPLSLISALQMSNFGIADMLVKAGSPAPPAASLLFVAPPAGDASDARLIKLLIARGADVNARDKSGHSVLMRVASSDMAPVETVKTLLEHSADVNAKSLDGRTALDFARQRGQSPIVELLVKAGAKTGMKPTTTEPTPSPAESPRAALARSIPLLQRTDVSFIRKSGCVSCHNNTLTAMTVASARKSGLPVDEQIARQQLEVISTYIDSWRERVLQGSGIPGDSDTITYILLGLAAEGHAPDPATDAMAHYVKSRQLAQGYWQLLAHRPPIESSEIEVTAASMRSLQLYAPRTRRAEYERAIERAADWLKQASPKSTEGLAFRALGLHWAGVDDATIRAAQRDLLEAQRSDGGWSPLPTMASDAYATGQALVALHEIGVAATDPGYQRGVKFLLNTQLEDGSWYVASRALPIQPHFESGFPHGKDQWISAAATNWAAMALVPAARRN